jgi:hypothetical protein
MEVEAKQAHVVTEQIVVGDVGEELLCAGDVVVADGSNSKAPEPPRPGERRRTHARRILLGTSSCLQGRHGQY